MGLVIPGTDASAPWNGKGFLGSGCKYWQWVQKNIHCSFLNSHSMSTVWKLLPYRDFLPILVKAAYLFKCLLLWLYAKTLPPCLTVYSKDNGTANMVADVSPSDQFSQSQLFCVSVFIFFSFPHLSDQSLEPWQQLYPLASLCLPPHTFHWKLYSIQSPLPTCSTLVNCTLFNLIFPSSVKAIFRSSA